MFSLVTAIAEAEQERKDNFRIVYSSEWTEAERKERQKMTANFTIKEVEKMPKEFKKDFKAGRVTAHVRQRDNGTFEVRCQYRHKKITASAKTLAEAKEKFIEKLQEPTERKVNARSVKFSEYVEKWLKTTKEPFVKPVTLDNYKRFIAYAVNEFGDRTLVNITQTQLQQFINATAKYSGVCRQVYTLLVSLFENAVGDGIIDKSPMDNVRLQLPEYVHGSPLTRDEERTLIDRLRAKPTEPLQIMVLCLYTGLRRAEALTARKDGRWIVADCGKVKKNQKPKTRRVPISPMLEQVIDLIGFKFTVKDKTLSNVFKRIIPSHHFHDLRHTFITRCQECGVRRELVSLWAGHAADSSITSTVYTHFEQNKELQIAEIKKVKY